MIPKNILITGGTGSFGTAFVDEALERGATRVCIFSRGEHRQAAMREALGNDERLRWLIGDVRDRDRLTRAMQDVELVVHAAALKRIETGHYNPIEMVKTNVDGAINVIEAAQDAGVERVIAVSSDKAYQPISAYGFSKAMAEALFLAANGTVGEYGPLFSVVRYGNVAGSAGSVIPLWRHCREHRIVPNGTDRDCTRFWMTMEEAVDLVMHVTQSMIGGELAIPTLPAYRLADLAEAMQVAPHWNGLPTWEKKHECMGPGNCSDTARRMTIPELKEALEHV